MPDLDPRIILAQRQLPTLADMQDEQQKRQIQEQEVELRRQEILARRDAIIEAAQRRNQVAQPKPLTPKDEMEAYDLRVKQATLVGDLLEGATDDDSYEQAKQGIAQIIGPDYVQHLPQTFDPAVNARLVAQGKALVAKATAGKLERVETVDPTDPTKKGVLFKTPVEGEFIPGPPTPTATSTPNPTMASLAVAAAKGDAEAAAALKIMKAQQASSGGGAATPLAATGGLDPDGLEYAAVKNRLTGTLPARDSKQNAAIINAAARQIKEVGQTPVAAIQKQAAYKGDAAALAQMTKMAASAEAFESKAMAQIGIIKDLSKKVPRTKWPVINSVLQAGRTEVTGDANATQLANAIGTFSTEYAKIMNGATGSAAGADVSSRADAARLINTAMSHGTMDKVLNLMQREMDLTMGGYDAVREHITTRMLGTGGAPATAAPAVVTPTLRFNPATGKIEPLGTAK